MKLIFKDICFSPFLPVRCCGAAIGLGIGAAVAGVANSVIASSSSRSNVSSQLAAQQGENALNRDWQTAEAEKARQYNTGERLATQEYQSGLIDKMNAYNSPENQAALFRSACINPNIALGGQGAIVSANPSQGSPQTSPMPSVVSGLSPVGFQPMDLHIPQLLNGIGGFLKDIGEAKKIGVDTDYAKASFDMNLRKLTADTSTQEFYAAGLQLENAIKNATKDASIEKAFEDCKKSHWEAILMEKQGISEDVRKRVLESQEELNKAVSDYHGKNADLLKLDIVHYEQAFNMRMKIGNSQVSSNYAAANASNASASKMYSEKDYQDMVNSIKRGSLSQELDSVLSSYAEKSQENKAKTEEFKTMLHRYQTLNKNNENGAADYLNYLMWFVKEQMPSLPIVPFLKLGK